MYIEGEVVPTADFSAFCEAAIFCFKDRCRC